MYEAGPAVSKSPQAVSAIWISWSAHRRTTGLCSAWDVPLYVLRPTRSDPFRWVGLSLKTLRLLRTCRPGILFVQNPSLVLTVLARLSRPLFGYVLVVDAHNEGVRPFDRPYAIVRWLTRRVIKAANFTIVSNEALADDVRASGGRPLVLPDAIPRVPALRRAPPTGTDPPDVAVIATFRRDEPIDAIMAAARSLPDVRFAFSGPAVRYRKAAGELPPNVRLTGFLKDPDYWRLLDEAIVVCDLTLKPDCLVCGAYEALALGKPMILSDNRATKRLFGKAAILTGNSPKEIAAAVRQAIDACDRLEANARRLRESYPARWQKESVAVWSAIQTRARRLHSA